MIYTGIGSRKTPPKVLSYMKRIAILLAKRGYTLRSGGAKGADSAFEEGCDSVSGAKEIFRAKDVPRWAYEEAQKHLPPGYQWNRTQPYVQALLARNMQQVLGEDGNSPTDFIICWTPADIKHGGGTGYALRCAKAHRIPTYNLRDGEERKEFLTFLRGEDTCPTEAK